MSNPVGGSGSRQHSLGVLASALGLSAKLFRINTYGQTPCFARFCPISSTRNPFRICTSKSPLHKLFRISTCRKQGGRGVGCPISYDPTLGSSPATNLEALLPTVARGQPGLRARFHEAQAVIIWPRSVHPSPSSLNGRVV